MSIAAMQKVWDEADCSGGELLVLLCLADHVGSDEKMIAWPSMALIARRARMSQRGAQKALKRLAEKGLIAIKEGGGRGGTNRYTLKIEMQPELSLEDEKPRTPVQGEQSSGGERSADEQSSGGVNFATKNPEPRFTQNQGNRKKEYVGSPDSKPAILSILTEFIEKEQAESFLTHRKALKKPLATARAAKGVAKHLAEIRDGGGDPEKAIDLAMERGWLTCEVRWYFERFGRGSASSAPASNMTPEQREHYRKLAEQRRQELEREGYG